jgi:hypothetical protein
MRALITQDGTVLVFDRDEGVVSGRSRDEAEAEIRRRKLARQQRARGLFA